MAPLRWYGSPGSLTVESFYETGAISTLQFSKFFNKNNFFFFYLQLEIYVNPPKKTYFPTSGTKSLIILSILFWQESLSFTTPSRTICMPLE